MATLTKLVLSGETKVTKSAMCNMTGNNYLGDGGHIFTGIALKMICRLGLAQALYSGLV